MTPNKPYVCDMDSVLRVKQLHCSEHFSSFLSISLPFEKHKVGVTKSNILVPGTTPRAVLVSSSSFKRKEGHFLIPEMRYTQERVGLSLLVNSFLM